MKICKPVNQASQIKGEATSTSSLSQGSISYVLTYPNANDYVSTSSGGDRITVIDGKSYDYNEAYNHVFSNEDKVKHFIIGSKNSNHHWNILGEDLNRIKMVVEHTLKYGQEKPYTNLNGIGKGMLKYSPIIINGIDKEVQISFIIDTNGIFRFSDGWIK